MFKKLALYILMIAISAIIGGGIVKWYFPTPGTVTIVRVPEKPYIAQPSKSLEESTRVTLPCQEIVAYKPTSRKQKAIEEKSGGLINGFMDILTIAKIEKLPYGGEAVVTLSPATQGGSGREASVTIIPRRAPFFEWTNERTVGVYIGVDNSLQRVFNAEFRQDLFRTGPAIWGIKTGVFVTPSKTIPYVMVGANVKF